MKNDENEIVSVTTVSEAESQMDACINTLSGRMFDYKDIRPEDIILDDIASALANICRFTGHVKEFYSVAQHSVLVSDAQSTLAEKRAGLLHDATEAYVNDLPSPMKTCVYLGDYKLLEDSIHKVINEKYNINDGMTDNIKKYDIKALVTEKRDLTHNHVTWEWAKDIECFDEVIIPLPPKEAKKLFMRRVAQLFPNELTKEVMESLRKPLI